MIIITRHPEYGWDAHSTTRAFVFITAWAPTAERAYTLARGIWGDLPALIYTKRTK